MGEIMSSDVRDGINDDKTGKVELGIQKVGVATVICNVARSPEVNVENVEGTAKWPRENELAI
jgi:hypothetical protein